MSVSRTGRAVPDPRQNIDQDQMLPTDGVAAGMGCRDGEVGYGSRA